MKHDMQWLALQPDSAWLAGAANTAAADPLTTLAWQALRFTPKVAMVHVNDKADTITRSGATAPNALVLEVSASERLFGGRERLLRLFYQQFKPIGLAKYAQAATSLIAIAKLQLAGDGPPSAAEVAGATATQAPWLRRGRRLQGPLRQRPPAMRVGELPLWTLAAACPHLLNLARVGCTTWGGLQALPRSGVVQRWGAALLDALDRAYGRQPEIYPWVTLPEVFHAQVELQARAESATALMFGAQRLLQQLQIWLQLRHCGVSALELGWTLDARQGAEADGRLVLGTAHATQDMAHLQRLLAENLARTRLPAPALHVHLRSLRTEPLAGVSASLLIEDKKKGDSLHEMVERLSARLGPCHVRRLQTVADYRPECMQSWPPVVLQNADTAAKSIAKLPDDLRPDELAPTWLLHEPLPLATLQGQPQHQGPLTLLAGPHRIETAWWEGVATLRDYYIAQSPHAGLVWVYRDRLSQPGTDTGWYLHGIYG